MRNNIINTFDFEIGGIGADINNLIGSTTLVL